MTQGGVDVVHFDLTTPDPTVNESGGARCSSTSTRTRSSSERRSGWSQEERMKRSLSILVAVVGAGSLGVSLPSCNTPSCGAGTEQVQQTDGTLKCVSGRRAAAGDTV